MTSCRFLMVQGTASGVGKTLLTTALCRIFAEDGYKVAPFKAQNLTSKWHTLPDGRLLASSQAMAAEACGILPTVDMNPVLIAPAGEETQCFLHGIRVLPPINEDFQKQAFDGACRSLKALAANYDIVVIEGAGSPVEMNLKPSDIVNMAIAKAVNAPVLLISDISRGGIFAALYGTLSLFSEEERALVKGLIVNHFIGDLPRFAAGHAMLEDLCQKPVLGVIPFLSDIALAEEDSLFPERAQVAHSKAAREAEFHRLAAHFRSHLNLPALYQLMENS